MKGFFSYSPFFRTLQSRVWPILILVLLWSSMLHAQQAPSMPRDLNRLVSRASFAFVSTINTRTAFSGIAREDTLEAIRIFSGHEGAVNAVGFSPDGTRIITGSDDQTVREWDIDTGEWYTPFEGHEGAVQAAFYAPDGATIWSAATDGKVIVRTSDGEVFWEGVFPLPVYSLKLSRDASKMLVGTGTLQLILQPRASVYFYDIKAGGPPVHVLGEKSGAGYYVAADYSPTEDKIVTGFLGPLLGNALLWDATTGASLYTLDQPLTNVRDAVFSPDGTQVLTASDDDANLWDVETGTHIRTFAGHAGNVNAVGFSSGGTVIVTGSSDQTARLWNTTTGELLQTLIGHTASINDVVFSPDGMYLLTAASDGTARLWATDLGNDELAPRPPAGLTAVPADREVTLTWNPNPEDDINGYRLYRDTAPSPVTPVVTIPADTETFTDAGLVNGTVYYYRLTAVNAAGVESGFSEEVNATPSSLIEEPPGFNWPIDLNDVDNITITQEYSKYNSAGLANTTLAKKYHSGIDFIVVENDIKKNDVPVKAAATGVVHAVRDDADFPNALGNVVILDHENGLYSLYAHLKDEVTLSGKINGGATIGIMGETGLSVGGSDKVHLHFMVMKAGDWPFGYYEDLPEGAQIVDPRLFIYPITEETISPKPIRMMIDGNVNVRSGPSAETVAGELPRYSVLTQVTKDQTFVAFAESDGWYKIDFPNAFGAASGWVHGSFFEETNSLNQIEVLSTVLPSGEKQGIRVRSRPLTTAELPDLSTIVQNQNGFEVFKIWDGQRYPVLDTEEIDGFEWYKINLPNHAAEAMGWVRDGTSDSPNYILHPGVPSTSSPESGSTTGTTAITLIWEASTITNTYLIQVSTDPEFQSLFADASIEGTSYTLTNLPVSTSFYWRVKAILNQGESNWSITSTFMTGTGVNTEMESVPDALYLGQNYPNPFRSKTKIPFTLNATGTVRIVVTDLLGREVLNPYTGKISPGNHAVEVDASSLPSGVYFYSLETEDRTVIRKFVVAR